MLTFEELPIIYTYERAWYFTSNYVSDRIGYICAIRVYMVIKYFVSDFKYPVYFQHMGCSDVYTSVV